MAYLTADYVFVGAHLTTYVLNHLPRKKRICHLLTPLRTRSWNSIENNGYKHWVRNSSL